MAPSKDNLVSNMNTSTPKIAMKGFSLVAKPGTKSISFTPKSKPLSVTLGKRPLAALQNGSDEEEDEAGVRHDEVIGFDIGAGGAQKKDTEEAKGPLIIPATKTRDWREEIRRATAARKGKNLLPPEVQAQRAGRGRTEGAIDVVNAERSEPNWGLTITRKEKIEHVNTSGGAATLEEDGKIKEEAISTEEEKPAQEKTEDELALEALTGSQSKKKGPDLVIPAIRENANGLYVPPPQLSEGDAYRRAIEAAPDVSTLDDYERVPVEEFGAALLRGMGWKEGDTKKWQVDRPKDMKRRQNLLGLGAKELKDAEELGAWVQKSDPKRLTTGSGRSGGDRRPKANEYRDQKEKKRESRDERYGGSHRRDRGREVYREKERDRDRDRRR